MNISKNFLPIFCGSLLLAGTASCVDNDYDLSDIDTTVRVSVNDLVLPINIDEIDLDNIINLKEDGIVKVINGQYAVVKEGTINSSSVQVDPINIKAPRINPTTDKIEAIAMTGANVTFGIKSAPSAFSFTSDYVNNSIEDISKVHANFSLDMDFSISPNPGGTISVEGLQIQLPKGLIMNDSKYDIATGIYRAASTPVVNGKATLHLEAQGIDFAYYPGCFNKNTRVITIASELSFKDGELRCVNATLYNEITLNINYTFSNIAVKSFDGNINYQIDGVNIPEVDITDLPDVLSQPGTDISIVNPVIYLNVSNPLQKLNLEATTGMSITPYRGSVASSACVLDSRITVGGAQQAGVPYGTYNYYLSPLQLSEADIDSEFPSAVYYKYSSLGKILQGNGLPDRLIINLVDPQVRQAVTNFSLGEDYGSVKGKYKFVAPIELGEGSKIVYSDREDGWFSDDLEYLTITKLDVNLNVTSELPIAVEFVGYPLDKNGNRIAGCELKSSLIEANATNQSVEIGMVGEVTNLDGIEFVATAVAGANTQALSPDMKIHLTNIRPCATGYYQKEL